MIEVLPADNDKAFKDFLYFPYKLYPKNSLWVPPLLSDIKEQFSAKNPFFKHAEIAPFIAKADGKTVGRITAIHNESYINFSGEKVGCFGFFDCIDRTPVALALIEKVKQWLKKRQLNLLRGPMNFSSNEEWGLLVDGYESPPMLMMPYNFPYYRSLLENCGMTKGKDLFAYVIDVPETLPEKTFRVARIAERRGITTRPIRIKSFQQDMHIFKDIYNSAWEKNWGFVPMTEQEIDHTAKKLKPLIIPELTLIAEHNRMPIGFMMFLPDFNYVLKKLNGHLFPFGIFKALWYSKKIKNSRLLLLGIKKGFRRRGVDALLFIEGLRALKKTGYKKIEFSWILEDNYPVQRMVETFEGELYKKYRIYETEI